MREQGEIVACLFDYFYYKLYKYSYKLDSTRARVKINNYLKRLSKTYPIQSLGISFFYSYFCFAFEFWSNKTTKRRITLDWIIGKKMIDRWISRSSHSNYFSGKFVKEYDIDLNHVIESLVDQQEIQRGIDPAEELEKTRHGKSEVQLLHCLHFTTLYNHKSIHCISCKQRDTCKEFLKKLHPQTYKRRGYETSTR